MHTDTQINIQHCTVLHIYTENCNLMKSMSKRCFGTNKSIVFVHSFAMAYHYPTYGSQAFVLKLREKPVSFIFHLFEFVALISIHFISSTNLHLVRFECYILTKCSVWFGAAEHFQCQANGQTYSLTTRDNSYVSSGVWIGLDFKYHLIYSMCVKSLGCSFR